MAQLKEDEWPEPNEPTLAEKEEALKEDVQAPPSNVYEMRMRGEQQERVSRPARMEPIEIPEAPWKSDR